MEELENIENEMKNIQNELKAVNFKSDLIKKLLECYDFKKIVENGDFCKGFLECVNCIQKIKFEEAMKKYE